MDLKNCLICLTHSQTKKLEIHKKYFSLEDPDKIEMPQNRIIKFKNHNRSIKVSSVAYPDFKSFR